MFNNYECTMDQELQHILWANDIRCARWLAGSRGTLLHMQQQVDIMAAILTPSIDSYLLEEKCLYYYCYDLIEILQEPQKHL